MKSIYIIMRTTQYYFNNAMKEIKNPKKRNEDDNFDMIMNILCNMLDKFTIGI